MEKTDTRSGPRPEKFRRRGAYSARTYREPIVRFALSGDVEWAGPAERQEALRRLEAQGRTLEEIAATLGITVRGARKIRARIRAISEQADAA